MFGYVKPDFPELKMKENELYKAIYCGLCKTMGKCTGCASQLTLSYDFTFLAMIRMVSEDIKGEIKMRNCVIHPLKKRPMLRMNSSLEYCAKTSVILTKLKLKDNINDSKGLSRLKAKTAGLVSIFFKKIEENLQSLEKKVSECIDNLTLLEKENSDSIDQTASTFGILLGILSSYGQTEENSRILYEIGYHLGKWIYVIDAIDDMEDDIKNKSFNVIVNNYGEKLNDIHRDALYCALMLELDSMSKSIELLDFTNHTDLEGIIKNVIYSGMVKTSRKILKLDDCDERCKSNQTNNTL